MKYTLIIVTRTRTIRREGLTKARLRTWIESWIRDDSALSITVEAEATQKLAVPA